MVVRMIAIMLCVAGTLGCRQPDSPRNADDPPPATSEQPRETWEAIYLAKTKVGYIHTVWSRDEKSDDVHVESHMKMNLKRGSDTSSVEQKMTTTETKSGQLREFRLTTKAGGAPSIVAGSVRGDSLEVVAESGGRTQKSKIPWSNSYGGFFALQSQLRADPMDADESRTQHLLMPGVDSVSVVEQTLQAIDVEDVGLGTTSKKLLKLRGSVKIGSTPMEVFIWCDDDGEVWKQEIPATRQTIIRTTRERALKENDKQLDIATESIVKLAQPIKQPHRTQKASYRVTLEQSDPTKIFTNCLSQTVKRVDDRTAEVIVQSISPNSPPAPLPLAIAPPTTADREPNQHIQSEDAAVVALSKQVAMDEGDAWKVAIALETHVKSSMKQTNYSSAFESAADVAKNRRGDCTEHAVLLAALCRARDIPARVATGLVYSEHLQGFAFHMWTEAWIEDRWIPLDATLGRGGTGAAHLKLSHSHLAGASEFDAFLPVSQVLWQLKIEVLRVQ